MVRFMAKLMRPRAHDTFGRLVTEYVMQAKKDRGARQLVLRLAKEEGLLELLGVAMFSPLPVPSPESKEASTGCQRSSHPLRFLLLRTSRVRISGRLHPTPDSVHS